METIANWGYEPSSSIVAVENGGCVDFVFNNTVTNTDRPLDFVHEGHHVVVEAGNGPLPDLFWVTPASGWEVVSDNSVMAPDWATTIVTICQMAFS